MELAETYRIIPEVYVTALHVIDRSIRSDFIGIDHNVNLHCL